MEKIAIIRRNGLGDLLCAYPLYRYLRHQYPTAKITLFVDERNAPLLDYFPEKFESVIFPKKGNKYFNLLKLALAHRGQKFDLAVSAKTSPMKMMNFFLFALGAKKRVAVAGKKWHSLLVNCPALPNQEAHQALKGLQMISPELKTIPEEFFPTLQVSEEMEKKHSNLVKVKGPLLLLSASTTKKESRLEEKKYAEVVNRLSLEFSFSAVIVGQSGDRTRAELIASHLKLPHQLHFPRNFEEFMVLLSKADLFFVGDGGVAHIGAALKAEEVVFFGGTKPEEWGPLNSSCVTFFHPKDVNLLSSDEMHAALRTKAKELLWKSR